VPRRALSPAATEKEPRSQREWQKQRTRGALIEAARSLIRSGDVVTMPAIAYLAQVSEATAYRHFPDLLTVLAEGFEGVWPDVSEALPDLESYPDPVARIGSVTEFLARNVLQLQGAVRTMIALTITRPEQTEGVRPAHRDHLIRVALEPISDLTSARRERLRQELSVVVSAEALFTLLDLRKLDPDEAVATLVETAQVLVRAAVSDTFGGRVPSRPAPLSAARVKGPKKKTVQSTDRA
jgi:AcrR family transcriptional regulator